MATCQGVDADRPLTTQEVTQFDDFSVELQQDEMSADDELLNKLVVRGCISRRQRATIDEKGENPFKRSDALLRILRRRGYRSLQKFVDALVETNQRHIADLLRTKMALNLKITMDIEPTIQEKCEKKLLDMIEEVRRDFNALDVLHMNNDLGQLLRNALVVKKGCISLIVFCPNNKRRKSLIKYVNSNRMKQDIEKWIENSYGGSEQIRVKITVEETYVGPEFKGSMQKPYSFFPSEVLEQILSLAILNWNLKCWKSSRHNTQKRDREIYFNLCSVCCDWTDIIRSSRLRHKLQRGMNSLYYPYRRRAKRMQRVETNAGVTGVTQLFDRLYVTVKDSDIIRVYDCSTPNYAALEPILAKGIENPWDLAACRLNHRIYITDCGVDRGGVYFIEIMTEASNFQTNRRRIQSQTSWPNITSNIPRKGLSHSVTNVDLRKRQLKEQETIGEQGWLINSDYIENSRGISVSRKSGHVIIVSWRVYEGGSVIFVIDPLATNDEYRIKNEIVLPASIEIPHHAVQTPDDRFVVGHGRGDETLHQVCLVSGDGEILKSFGGRMLPVSRVINSVPIETNEFMPTEIVFEIKPDEDIHSVGEYNHPSDEYIRQNDDEYRQLNTPYAVAIDYVEKMPSHGEAAAALQSWNVIVTDYGGRRILVLDSDLNLMMTLLTNEENGIDEPRQVWMDSTSGRLYVGQDTGCVDVFSIYGRRQSNSNAKAVSTNQLVADECPGAGNKEASIYAQHAPPLFTCVSLDSDEEK